MKDLTFNMAIQTDSKILENRALLSNYEPFPARLILPPGLRESQSHIADVTLLVIDFDVLDTYKKYFEMKSYSEGLERKVAELELEILLGPHATQTTESVEDAVAGSPMSNYKLKKAK